MRKSLVLAAVLAVNASAADAFFFKGLGEAAAENPAVKHTRAMDYTKPAANFGGQHFTNKYGCTYSRTQAPGHPMVWFLQVNTRANGCPNTIPG